MRTAGTSTANGNQHNSKNKLTMNGRKALGLQVFIYRKERKRGEKVKDLLTSNPFSLMLSSPDLLQRYYPSTGWASRDDDSDLVFRIGNDSQLLIHCNRALGS